VVSAPEKHSVSMGKTSGSSPAEDRYYVVVIYDISDAKKYRMLVKTLQRYGTRIQKSVYEANLKRSQIKRMLEAIEKLMASEKYYNPSDNVRVYKISGGCDVTVFGTYESNILEENIFC